MIAPHPTGSVSIRKEWQYNCEINTHTASLQNTALPTWSASNWHAEKLLFRALSGWPQLVVEGIEEWKVGERWVPGHIWGAGRESGARLRCFLVCRRFVDRWEVESHAFEQVQEASPRTYTQIRRNREVRRNLHDSRISDLSWRPFGLFHRGEMCCG